jgi:DNA recombination protein RmuC
MTTLTTLLLLVIILVIIFLFILLGRESKEQLKGIHSLREELKLSLAEHREKSTEQLHSISEKNMLTFADVVKRLAIIDEAQKRINELSSNIMSLQSILDDKRSRGAFGEIQLAGLIKNMMPERSFSLQHTLSNGKRCDCLLLLPPPSGNVVIDAKFPLETYRKLTSDAALSELSLKQLQQQFRQDLKLHIQSIAEKYLIPGETADGAMMFIPAEAIFSDIHAHYADIVDYAQQKRVWLVSPTTMMAILTTARAVLKDADTREQMHIIQKHLNDLAKDFSRFQSRMDNLVKHIDQARNDADDVNKSAKKISSRFSKIEKLEIAEETEIV